MIAAFPSELNAHVMSWLEEQGIAVPPPRPTDELGTLCLYRAGVPPSPSYPKPADLRWMRLLSESGAPAKLWMDGATSSDPKQGQIGDCWLISALSLIATRDGACTCKT